jgi:hypothetical protein
MGWGVDGTEFPHQDANSVIVESHIIHVLNAEVKDSPVGINQLNHAISEVCRC